VPPAAKSSTAGSPRSRSGSDHACGHARMTARAGASAPPARDRLRISGRRHVPISFSRLARSRSPSDVWSPDTIATSRTRATAALHWRSPCNGQGKYGDRGAMSAPSSGRFLLTERAPSAWLRHPCRVDRSEERCCHISRALLELSESARAPISEQILRSRPSQFPQAQQASNPCLSRSFGRSRPMKTSRVWRASCSFQGR
jgi:hypothetical protein